MSTVIVQVEMQPQPFPAGTVPAGVKITLSNGAAQVIAAAPYSATFTDVAPGSYTASAQAVDAAGADLGAAAVSAEFTIAAPVSVDVPSVVTVTVQ